MDGGGAVGHRDGRHHALRRMPVDGAVDVVDAGLQLDLAALRERRAGADREALVVERAELERVARGPADVELDDPCGRVVVALVVPDRGERLDRDGPDGVTRGLRKLGGAALFAGVEARAQREQAAPIRRSRAPASSPWRATTCAALGVAENRAPPHRIANVRIERDHERRRGVAGEEDPRHVQRPERHRDHREDREQQRDQQPGFGRLAVDAPLAARAVSWAARSGVASATGSTSVGDVVRDRVVGGGRVGHLLKPI